MNAVGSSQSQRGYVSNAPGKRMMLDLDLNNPPPGENMALSISPEVQGQGDGGDQGHATYNDDVEIISPRKFAEAKNNAQRRRGGIERPAEVLADWLRLNNAKQRTQNDQTTFSLELCLNFEDNSNSQDMAFNIPMPPTLPQSRPAVPETPTFTCGICIDKLVEETSTKCGHIFCKNCIEVAIAKLRKCPTCRRKLRKQDTIRVYLPTAS
ncbi:hypothetical protein UlMin_010390 [Ulmus minor]